MPSFVFSGNNSTLLAKTGNGTWDVTNTHNSDAASGTGGAAATFGGYGGGTVINGGTLGFETNAIGGGVVDFTGNSTLRWDNTNITIAQQYNGAGTTGGTTDLANTQDITSGTGAGVARSVKFEDGVTATFDTNGNAVTLANAFSLGTNKTAGLTVASTASGGVLSLSAANLYTGATTISSGTLRANNGASNGSATGTSNIAVSPGTSNYGGAKLGGNGVVTGTVSLATSVTAKQGGIIAAGADDSTTGKLTTGNETWNGGAAYQWKINTPGDGVTLGNRTTVSGNTTAGGTTGYDFLQIGGNLTSGSLLNVLPPGGNSTVFTVDPIGNITVTYGKTYNWMIAQIGSGAGTQITLNNVLTGNGTAQLSTSIFSLDTSNLIVNGSSTSTLSNAGNFGLYFETISGNNDLVLSYDATPEPGTALLVLGGVAPMLTGRRRRSRRSTASSQL